MQHLPHFRRATAVAALTLLAACTTIDPYTGEERRSKASTGAAIGAVAGAIVGAATGDDAKERRKRALIGASGGALAGGSAGYYMDRQEQKLREELRGTGVGVTREGDNITLNMPGNITFATDSASLNPEFFDVLAAVAKVIKEYEKTLVSVTGHTDSTGADDYNQQLSERRAATVGGYLNQQGVSTERLVIIGYGEQRPVAPNSSPEGRARNRRVEITLEPITR